MSLSAYLVAVRNRLRTKLSLSPGECMVRPDGRPIPSCGDTFVAVYGSARIGEEELEVGIAKNYGISCTITIRTAYIPDDLLGEEAYVKSLVGLEVLAEKVEGYIHKSFEAMAEANDLIRDSSYKIIEPLRWTDSDAAPTIVRDDWFNPDSTRNDPAVGMTMTIRFSNARRKQPMSDYP